MTKLKLLNSTSQWGIFSAILVLIFSLSLFYEYTKYTSFKQDSVYTTSATILNIYPKETYQTYKLKTSGFICFTSVSKKYSFNKGDDINITLLTKQVDFIGFLKGFYIRSFNLFFEHKNKSNVWLLVNKISQQHESKNISTIFAALFLAIPLSASLRDIFASYGISHLIAISGFHLSVLSFILYWIFYFCYQKVHQIYFPYRNKKMDILIAVIAILFSYLLFTSIVPSLLRAFVMLCLGLFLLRSNIKLLSFETLLITVMIIVALFPKYLFSLSLWFSLMGVFYIYLFLEYFKNLNKIVLFFFFNIWIFLAVNPIVHYFFTTTALEQLLSPFLSIIFSVFYPFELFLHIIGKGSFLDDFVKIFLAHEIDSYDIQTPLWFFVVYSLSSFYSIIEKRAFFVLNALLLVFNMYLFIR